jgi:hypothetical protein
MGLWQDIRASIEPLGAATGDVTVRDLVSIGQVTQHVVDSSVTSYMDVPQGCGDPEMHGSAPCEIGSFVPMHGEPVYEYDEPEGGTWLYDEYGIPYWTSGDVVEATVSATVVCDIASDEEAEQDAAELAYLRSFGMGTWLTSQPNRFRYATPAYRGSSR